MFSFQDLSIKLVTRDIVSGHVVPDNVLFTRPIEGVERRTATFDENEDTEEAEIRVTAVIQGSRDGGETFF